jgi:hypothetical protein
VTLRSFKLTFLFKMVNLVEHLSQASILSSELNILTHSQDLILRRSNTWRFREKRNSFYSQRSIKCPPPLQNLQYNLSPALSKSFVDIYLFHLSSITKLNKPLQLCLGRLAFTSSGDVRTTLLDLKVTLPGLVAKVPEVARMTLMCSFRWSIADLLWRRWRAP